MKKYIITGCFLGLAALIILGSCKKTYKLDAGYQLTDSAYAHLKIIDASPSFRLLTNYQDTFNVAINGNKVTGTTPLSYGSIFPSNNYNTYMTLPPGATTITLSIPGVVTPDSVTILTLNKTLAAGGYYTLMLTDSLFSTRDSNRIFVSDLFQPVPPGYMNMRFINAAVNDTIGKLVDLFSYASNTNVLSKIKPDSVTSFSARGVNPTVPDTFYVRRSGTTQVLAKMYFNPFAGSPTGGGSQRAFTFYYYGDATTNTGKKARTLANYLNN